MGSVRRQLMANQFPLRFFDYLKGDWNTYIDTGYYPNGNTKIVAKIKRLGKAMSFGCRHSSFDFTGGEHYTDVNASGGKEYNFRKDWLGQTELSNAVYDNDIHDWEFGNNYFCCDGTKEERDDIVRTQSELSLYLYKVNSDNVVFSQSSPCIFYSFQIYESGVCVRNFIPATYNGVPCMWDTVECKPYYNSNSTGSFSVGEERKLVPFTDVDGKKIMTSLPNGVAVNWRQMANELTNSTTSVGINYTYLSNGIWHVEGQRTEGSTVDSLCNLTNFYSFVNGRKYIMLTSGSSNVALYISGVTNWKDKNSVCYIDSFLECIKDNDQNIRLYVNSKKTNAINENLKVHSFDLTSLFSLSPSYLPTTTDAFKSLFHSQGSADLGYTEYTEEPVQLVAKNGVMCRLANKFTNDTLTFTADEEGDYTMEIIDGVGRQSRNLWDEKWIQGYLSNGEVKTSANGSITSVNFIEIDNSKNYYIRVSSAGSGYTINLYDSNKDYISAGFVSGEFEANCKYIRFGGNIKLSEYANDICINESNSVFNGTYEPHGTIVDMTIDGSWSPKPIDRTSTIHLTKGVHTFVLDRTLGTSADAILFQKK